MEKTAKAAIGRITFHSRERPVLVHYYRQAVVATTLRYPEEVLDPQGYQAIKDLPEPQEKELELAMEIIKSLSGELDLSAYHDQYKERIETLVRSKMEGAVAVPEKKKAGPSAKSLMEALRLTAESLKMKMNPVKPMLAVSGRPFNSAEWIFEPKIDGTRCIAEVSQDAKRRAPPQPQAFRYHLSLS